MLVNPEKRDIGMVFQSYAVWPHMTVLQNVAYPLRARAGGARYRAKVNGRWSWSAGDSASGRTSRPAASSSAWRSRAAWSLGRSCSCSTSHSAISTPSCASGWRRNSRIERGRASPASTSRTTRPRRLAIASGDAGRPASADRNAEGSLEQPANSFVANLTGASNGCSARCWPAGRTRHHRPGRAGRIEAWTPHSLAAGDGPGRLAGGGRATGRTRCRQ